jgi:putative transposase
MSKLARPSTPKNASLTTRIFFVATQTAGRRRLFQTERMANLFIEVLRDQMRAGRFVVPEFVIMPDHVHLLITVPAEMTIEKAMQFIKGNFSIRAGRDLGFQGEIWQRGFSEVQVLMQLRKAQRLHSQQSGESGNCRKANRLPVWFSLPEEPKASSG